MENIICENCSEVNTLTSKYCSKCGYKLTEIEKTVINSVTSKPEMEKKPIISKKLIGIAITMISFFIFYFFGQKLFNNSNSIDSELTKISSEMNKNCPFFVDEDTKLENTITFPNKIIQYNYILVNLSKEEVNITEASDFIYKNSVENIQNHPSMKFMKDNNVRFIYSYKDKNGKFIFKTEVNPEDYSD